MNWQLLEGGMGEYREDEDISFELNLSVRCCPNGSWWWHPKWIPLLANQKGVRLCLDLAPGPAGQIGQIIALDFDSGDICPSVIATGWQAFLSAFADDLEAEDYSLWENSAGETFLS
jgi:cell wall assembly regulator SMI1